MESQEKLDPASGGKAALKPCPFQKVRVTNVSPHTPSLGYKGWGLYGTALKIFGKIRVANPEPFQEGKK